MNTIESKTIDRRTVSWGTGPWDGEPDKVQWEDPATSLPCLAVRNQFLGNWCGYVAVPPGNRLHGRRYNEIDDGLDVHGGLSFSGACSGEGEAHGICHVPGPGEPDDVWWFGFDCNHYMDYAPGAMDCALRSVTGYRDLEYVKEQCARLAAQLKELS